MNDDYDGGWVGGAFWSMGARSDVTLSSVLEMSSRVTVAIHGGSLDELLGVAVLGANDSTGEWLSWGQAYISEMGMLMQGRFEDDYQSFIRDGDLRLEPADVNALLEVIQRCNDTGKVRMVGLEPSGLGEIVDRLAEIGLSEENGKIAGIRQGASLSGAIKTVERMLSQERLFHSGSAMMRWCAKNAAVEFPPLGGVVIARRHAPINPLMALMMAVELMCVLPSKQMRGAA